MSFLRLSLPPILAIAKKFDSRLRFEMAFWMSSSVTSMGVFVCSCCSGCEPRLVTQGCEKSASSEMRAAGFFLRPWTSRSLNSAEMGSGKAGLFSGGYSADSASCMNFCWSVWKKGKSP